MSLKYCIVGAGSVGGYFGGRLIQSGHEVTFLVREGRQKQLQRDGLKIRSYLGNADLLVNAETDEKKVKSCDVLVLAIRNFNFNEDVVSKIEYFSKRGAKFISLLNGVEHIERLRKLVPENQILGGTAFIDSRLDEKNEIIHRGQEPTIRLGTLDGKVAAEISQILEDLRASGIKAEVEADLLEALWRKFTFVLLGTFTGVTNANIGTIVANRWLNRVLEDLAMEIKSVANSEGVNITKETVLAMLTEIREMRKEWKSLLTEDIEAGRKNELESLWGYIVRKADINGLEAPLSRLCYGVFKLKDSSSGTPGGL